MQATSTARVSDIRMDYMNLLIAQLRNQNPLDPMDNSQMTAQLTAMGQLEQLENMSNSFQDVLLATERGQAASMIGKQVGFVTGSSYGAMSGRVESVEVVDDQVRLRIGDPLRYAVNGVTASTSAHLDELEQVSDLGRDDTITVYGTKANGEELNFGRGVQIDLHEGFGYLTVGEMLEAITDAFKINGQETYVARMDNGQIRLINKYTGESSQNIQMEYQGAGRFELPQFARVLIDLRDVTSIGD